jgi:hypothetical protein
MLNHMAMFRVPCLSELKAVGTQILGKGEAVDGTISSPDLTVTVLTSDTCYTPLPPPPHPPLLQNQ